MIIYSVRDKEDGKLHHKYDYFFTADENNVFDVLSVLVDDLADNIIAYTNLDPMDVRRNLFYDTYTIKCNNECRFNPDNDKTLFTVHIDWYDKKCEIRKNMEIWHPEYSYYKLEDEINKTLSGSIKSFIWRNLLREQVLQEFTKLYEKE